MVSPFPALHVQPLSGLTFPWLEMSTGLASRWEASFSPDGVAFTMPMLIYWADLKTALQQLLGYSWRDTTVSPSVLRRKLPWQHPFANQLWVRSVSSVKGYQQQARDQAPGVGGGGAGAGFLTNDGPWSSFTYAELLINFWRPPYYVRSDADILDNTGSPQEWLRYVDKHWNMNSQMLSRKDQTFQWRSLAGGAGPPGTVGQLVTHGAYTRKWYQVPEAGLFKTLQDKTPSGLPYNLLYTQSPVTNPVTAGIGGTNYVYPAGSPVGGCINIGEAYVVATAGTTANTDTASLSSTVGITVGMTADGGTFPAGTTVVGVGGASVTLSANAVSSGTYTMVFEDQTKAFMGLPMGTLRIDHADLTPQPLQLPPPLMQIPLFNGGEPISQNQYDVTFNFDFFDPPRGLGEAFRGHNLMPYAGNGLWYSVYAQKDVNAPSGVAGPWTTPFQYMDFRDLFQIL